MLVSHRLQNNDQLKVVAANPQSSVVETSLENLVYYANDFRLSKGELSAENATFQILQ
jgi:hypothetical protein